MGDGGGDAFPSLFYSKAPIPETVERIPLKQASNKFFWALSIADNTRHEPKSFSTLAPYEDNESDLLDCGDLDDNYEINPTKSGKYITSFYVPTLLHSVIVGPRGSKLRELQDNTTTLIKVPKPDEGSIIKVTGHSERSVASARTQITLLLLSKREKLSITHFVSIRVFSQEIIDNFFKFKDGIVKGPSTRGIDESIFQKVEKFHLTIVTIALLDEKEITEASSILQKFSPNLKRFFTDKKPKITLKGVEIMNDDPSEVDVLYGKVSLNSDEENIQFQALVSDIFEAFSKNGLVRKQYDSVKLHVTLMNSLFRKNDGYQRGQDVSSRRETFDASYILKQYKDFYFGKSDFNQIDLSVRFTTGKTGYYNPYTYVTI